MGREGLTDKTFTMTINNQTINVGTTNIAQCIDAATGGENSYEGKVNATNNMLPTVFKLKHNIVNNIHRIRLDEQISKYRLDTIRTVRMDTNCPDFIGQYAVKVALINPTTGKLLFGSNDICAETSAELRPIIQSLDNSMQDFFLCIAITKKISNAENRTFQLTSNPVKSVMSNGTWVSLDLTVMTDYPSYPVNYNQTKQFDIVITGPVALNANTANNFSIVFENIDPVFRTQYSVVAAMVLDNGCVFARKTMQS